MAEERADRMQAAMAARLEALAGEPVLVQPPLKRITESGGADSYIFLASLRDTPALRFRAQTYAEDAAPLWTNYAQRRMEYALVRLLLACPGSLPIDPDDICAGLSVHLTPEMDAQTLLARHRQDMALDVLMLAYVQQAPQDDRIVRMLDGAAPFFEGMRRASLQVAFLSEAAREALSPAQILWRESLSPFPADTLRASGTLLRMVSAPHATLMARDWAGALGRTEQA